MEKKDVEKEKKKFGEKKQRFGRLMAMKHLILVLGIFLFLGVVLAQTSFTYNSISKTDKINFSIYTDNVGAKILAPTAINAPLKVEPWRMQQCETDYNAQYQVNVDYFNRQKEIYAKNLVDVDTELIIKLSELDVKAENYDSLKDNYILYYASLKEYYASQLDYYTKGYVGKYDPLYCEDVYLAGLEADHVAFVQRNKSDIPAKPNYMLNEISMGGV